MQFLRARVVFSFVALAVIFTNSSINAQWVNMADPSAGDSRFGWVEGDAGSAWAEWDVFTSAFSGANVPDVESNTGNTSIITQTVSGAFLASSGNIYSPTTVNDFDLTVDTSSLDDLEFTRVVAQFKTLGNELDYGSILLGGTAPTYTEELDRSVLGGFGGASVEYLALWDIDTSGGGTPDVADSYQIDFTASGTSLSLDRVRVDASSQSTAFASAQSVPEPSSVLLVLAGASGLLLRRRRKSS